MTVAKAGRSDKVGRGENHLYVRSVSFRPRGRMDGKTLSMALSVSMAMGFEALLVDGVLEGRIQAQATTDDGQVRVTHSGPGPKVEVEDSLGGAMVREGKVRLEAELAGCTEREVARALDRAVSVMARYLWIEREDSTACAIRMMATR